MELFAPPEPIDADDAFLAEAVEHAEPATLLAALAHATGDLSLLADHLRPDASALMDPSGGLSPEAQAEARARALEVLKGIRDGAVTVRRPGEPVDESVLLAVVDWLTGGADPDLVPLLEAELGIDGLDPRRPGWRFEELAGDRPFRVLVIGAGMSGIAVAHRLAQAGVPFVVVDKNDDVGGTWHENRYPGCRVDVTNFFYSYSFAQRTDWPYHFSPQPVLHEYFRSVVDHFGLRDHIRLRTEVRSLRFDEERARWVAELQTPEGTEHLEADVVVSAVGQLNRPKLPDIEGRDDFAGPAFHSARWDHDVDLTGRRVAVIGTGASAVQLIPPVAEAASELLVFQRTPPWLIPVPHYTDEVDPKVRWLFRHVPGYGNWYRFWVFWRNTEGLLPAARVDPDWDGGGESVSAVNDGVRQMLVGYLQACFADRPDLLEACTPHYPPFAKRFLLDNGLYPATLKRDDVRLITTPIERIEATGIRTADGTLHEVDVIIYGTGFQASRFLTPMRVTGRGGVDLHERWGGDARAYLGLVVPGFPNLFLMYGPNTNIVANGSIIYFSECEASYILDAVRWLLAHPEVAALDCRPEVHDAYNRRIDEGNLRMAWGVSTVNSWYRNEFGRSAQNWPFTLTEYWAQTREMNPDDYELIPAPVPSRR